MAHNINLDTEAIDTVRNIIENCSYKRIISIPAVKNNFFPVNDIDNMMNFFRGGNSNRLYSYSIFPQLYEYLHGLKDKGLCIIYKLFFKNVYVSEKDVKKVLNETNLTVMLEKNLLKKDGGNIYSLIKITPYNEFFFITTGSYFKDVNKRVYMGGDSFLLADDINDIFSGGRFRRSLDVCTGSGIQAINISRFSDSVTALDLNPNALSFAEKNLILNKKNNVEFVLSDLYENISQKYDLIVSNTPYCFVPDDFSHWLPAYGGKLGMEIPLKIVEGFKDYLHDGGMGFACLASPVMDGRDMLIEELEKLFSSENFAIEARTIQYCITPVLAEFYKKNNIEYFKFYHILFKKGAPYSLKIKDLSPAEKIAYKYIVAANKVEGYYNKQLDRYKNRLFSLAEKEKARGNIKEAINIYSKILRDRPDSLKAHLELGKLYEKVGDFHKAEELFKITLSLYPEFTDGHCYLAYFYLSRKRLKEGKKHFLKAFSLAKQNNFTEMEDELKIIIEKLNYI